MQIQVSGRLNCPGVCSPDNFYHTIREVLLPPPTVRNYISTRAFSEANDALPKWPQWSGLPCQWYPHLWKKQRGPWQKTSQQRIAAAGLTLNCEKCEFAQTRVKFLGRVVDEMSIRPDPDKVNSIRRMQQPSNITELHQFLSMVNQLSKFSPQLPEKTKPLWDLLSAKNQWVWGRSQQQAFDNVKADLSSVPPWHYMMLVETHVSVQMPHHMGWGQF